MQVAFEVRLAEGDSQVDVSQLFSPDHGMREVMTDYARHMCQEEQQVWPLIREFSEQWSKADSAMHEAVSLAWLEYDLPGDPPSVLRPGVFIALPDQLAHAESRLSVMKTTLQLLGHDPSGLQAIFDRLGACLQALPASAVAITVGVMPSRQIQGVRLPVHYIGKQAVIPYLRQVGWPGELDQIERLVERYFDLSDRIAVDLDIGANVYPQLGLELHLASPRANDSRWEKLLDQLVSDHLCDPAKRDALLIWPGQQTPTEELVNWPGNLMLETLLRGAEGAWLLARGLSHVKLVYKPGSPVSAKAYFGYMIEWVNRNQ
jgi:hypothetical protein